MWKGSMRKTFTHTGDCVGIEDGKYLSFRCKKGALANKIKCIFHDDEYYKEHTQEISQLLLAEVNESVLYDKELFWIGYRIVD